MMSTFFAILFYFATLVFVVGSLYRISVYTRTPAPLKIPTTPAPTTSGGVVLRMMREVFLFESLFKANLWTWGAGWLFHASLALVLLRHLRYFTEPVWRLGGDDPALRHVCRHHHGARRGRALGAADLCRAYPLYLHAIRSPDAGTVSGDRPVRADDEIHCAWRCDRREGIHARSDAFQFATVAFQFPAVPALCRWSPC